MGILFLGLMLVASGKVVAQDGAITLRSESLTLTLPVEVDELLNERKVPKKEEERIRPEFCQGARIQLFYGKDRTEAERILAKAKSIYPQMHSNLVYEAPDYKVKVGYFDSVETAKSVLSQTKREFPLSLSVPEIIRCGLLDQTTR